MDRSSPSVVPSAPPIPTTNTGTHSSITKGMKSISIFTRRSLLRVQSACPARYRQSHDNNSGASGKKAHFTCGASPRGTQGYPLSSRKRKNHYAETRRQIHRARSPIPPATQPTSFIGIVTIGAREHCHVDEPFQISWLFSTFAKNMRGSSPRC